MCSAAYQLKLFGEDTEVYYNQFFDDNRHRIVLRPTSGATIMRIEDGRRVMRSLQWGLVPFWAKDRKIAYQTFNARAETIETKPAFRESFIKRRGVLVWESYVEWRVEAGIKVPYEFGLKEPGPIFLAGLWASWGQEESYFESCTLITCEPNALAANYHNRMPVIFDQESVDSWLDPTTTPKDLTRLLTPFDDRLMTVKYGNPKDFKRKAA